MTIRNRLRRARLATQAEVGQFMDSDRAQLLGGIGSGLSDAVDGITGRPSSSQGGAEFILEEQNFDNTFGDNLTAGSFVDAAAFIAPAQTQFNVGYGSGSVGETVGRWFAHLEDGAGNVVTGQCRIITRNANDKEVETDISGVTTSRLDANQTDKRTQYAIPEVKETSRIGEDSKVVFQFRLDSGSTGTTIDFTAGATEFQLSLTEYS